MLVSGILAVIEARVVLLVSLAYGTHGFQVGRDWS